MLSRWHITLQAQSYDIPPGHIIPAAGQLVFCIELRFKDQALDKGASTTNLKSFVWLGQGSNTGPARHGTLKYLLITMISSTMKYLLITMISSTAATTGPTMIHILLSSSNFWYCGSYRKQTSSNCLYCSVLEILI